MKKQPSNKKKRKKKKKRNNLQNWRKYLQTAHRTRNQQPAYPSITGLTTQRRNTSHLIYSCMNDLSRHFLFVICFCLCICFCGTEDQVQECFASELCPQHPPFFLYFEARSSKSINCPGWTQLEVSPASASPSDGKPSSRCSSGTV